MQAFKVFFRYLSEQSRPTTPIPCTNYKNFKIMTADNSKQRIIAISSVVVVALLIVSAILLFNKFKQDKKLTQQEIELQEKEELRQQLEDQYNEAITELESMRGENEELNALIEQQQAELSDQKAQIDKLIRNGRDLRKARAQIKKLNAQIEQYIAEVETLRAENEQLKQEKEMLSSDLEMQRQTNEQLNQERAQLVSEKDQLASKADKLSKTVTYASVIRPNNITVTGYLIKSSGKRAKKKAAKNVDVLEICFQTTVNEVAKPGREVYHIRIIDPLGQTLAVDELGSGVLTNSGNGEKIRYTTTKEFDYSQDETQLCVDWQPQTPFQSGTYEVEIYNKGYLAGTGTFTLK